MNNIWKALGAGLLLCAPPVWGIPSAITYQGALKDKGAPANGARQMLFRITNHEGTQVYWSSGNLNIAVQNGLFSAQINPVGVDWENVTPYLEISVEGQQLLPREPVSATVYASVSNSVVNGSITPAKVATGYGLVPNGMIALFASACPAGWSRYEAMDDRFAVGSSTPGVTGGALSHDHSIATGGEHNHGGATGAPGDHFYADANAGRNFGSLFRTHTHPIFADGSHHHGGATGSTSTLPPYRTMVYLSKNITSSMKLRYKKMLAGMKDDGGTEWFVYILKCADGTLYTGITKDLISRVAAHNGGRGGAYTRTHRPVTLLYSEPGFSRASALRREAAIKRLPRPRKVLLLGLSAIET